MSDSSFFPPGRKGPRGDAGPRGPQGPVGPGVTWRGGLRLSSPDADGLPVIYEPNDLVEYNGSSYVVRQEFEAGDDFIPEVSDGWDNYFEVVAHRGNQGPQGGTGPEGGLGPQGIPGQKGDRGASGNPGTYQEWLDRGNSGSYTFFLDTITGAQGEKGDPGEPGTFQEWLDRGNSGDYSDFLETIRGVQGPKGEMGSPGTYEEAVEKHGFTGTYQDFLEALRGRQGITGPTGSTGAKGEKGDQGVPGDPGTYEDWLAQGNSGSYAAFLNAIRGAQGPKGDTGEPGTYTEWLARGNSGTYDNFLDAIRGRKGDKGDPGLAGTYAEWLDRGNNGSYAQFLALLKGQKGDTGAKGDPGKQGEPGQAVYKGDQGPIGPVGPSGPAGPRGVNWLGPWDPDYKYQRQDAVAYQGGSWICVSDAQRTNQTPGFSGDWEALAERGSVIGVKGQKGDKGDPGADGADGAPGERGPAGADGATGPKGDQGPAGPTGPAGADGPAGPKGDQGLQGIQGLQGVKGDAGTAGPAGLNWRGAWDAATAYAINDAVTFNGATYRRTVAGTTALDPGTDATTLSNSLTFTYQTGGDTNGVVYWLGTTDSGNANYVNPVPVTGITVNAPYTADGTNLAITVSSQQAASVAGYMTDRRADLLWGGNVTAPGAYAVMDFKTRRLAPTTVTVQVRANFRYAIKGFAFDGSNDGNTWTTLLDVADAGFTAGSQWKNWPVAGAAAYRYLRFRQTTPNIEGTWDMQLAEVELYGVLSGIGSRTPNWQIVAAKGDTGATGPAGAAGAVGAAGPAGATGPAGPAGLTWRGAWAAGTAYAVNDAATYNGSSYRRLVAGTSASTPDTDAVNWTLFAAKGDVGAQGPAGPAGAAGTGGSGAGVTVCTWQTRPTAASAGVGGMCFCTDLTDPMKFQISTGAKWLAVSDGTTVVNWAPGVTLTWQADGDTNGLFYYLGTRDQVAYVNPVPVTAGTTVVGTRVTVFSSTTNGGAYSPGHLSDRLTTGAGTGDAFSTAQGDSNSSITIDLKTATFAPTRISLRHFNETSWAMNNFVVEGSNDNAVWTNLLTVTNAAEPAAFAWRNWAIVGAGAYRYLRVRQTAVSSHGTWGIDLAEWEWYGTLAPGYATTY